MVTEAMISLAATQLWQLTAVVLVVAAIVRFTARRCPPLAAVLWMVVLAKCLTPPLWSSPGGVFCWWQPFRQSAVSDLSRQPDDLDQPSHETTAVAVTVLPDSEPQEPAARQPATVLVSPPESTSTAVVGPSSPATFSWATTWIMAWVSSVVCWLLVSACRWRVCWRRICGQESSMSHDLQPFVNALAKRLKIRRPVRVLVTASRVGPAVCGIFRPTIVLPEVVLKGKALPELEPILAHELLHIRRGDLPLGLLQTLAQAVWWFHPGVWWANRALSRELERCCDEQVLAELGCHPSRYARSLIEVLERKRMLTPVPLVPGVRPVEVTSERLERIMKLGQGCRRRSPWWCWLVLLFAGTMVLPGAAWVAGDENQTTQPARDAAVKRIARSEAAPGVPDAIRVYDAQLALRRVQESLRIGRHEAQAEVVKIVTRMVGSQAGEPALKMSWHKDHLVASHCRQGHTRLAAALAYLEDRGLEQIMIETHLFRGTSEDIQKLNDRWSILSVRGPDVPTEPSATPGSSDAERKVQSVSTTVERRSPVVFTLLDEEQAQQFVEQTKKGRLRVEASPSVLTFCGRQASILSGGQRPFVVGVQPDANQQLQPEIRVVDFGWKLNLLPVMINQNQLVLDCNVTFTEIPKVHELDIRVSKPEATDATATDKQLTVQVPEVKSINMQSAFQLELNQTILIGALNTSGDEEERSSILMVVKCSRIEPLPPQDQPVPPSAVAPQIGSFPQPQPLPDLTPPPLPAAPQPRVRVESSPYPTAPTANAEPWPIVPPADKSPSPLREPLRPVEQPSPRPAAKPEPPATPLPQTIGRQLTTAGIRWQIDGASSMQMTDNTFELEAEQIQLEIPTKKGTQLLVRAEQAKVQSNGDRLTVWLAGNVQLESQDGTRLSGAKAELRIARHGDDSYTLEFHGLK